MHSALYSLLSHFTFHLPNLKSKHQKLALAYFFQIELDLFTQKFSLTPTVKGKLYYCERRQENLSFLEFYQHFILLGDNFNLTKQIIDGIQSLHLCSNLM